MESKNDRTDGNFESADDTVTDKALELFDQGFNCAQSVFAAFAPSFGLDVPMVLKIAAALVGGMSRCNGVWCSLRSTHGPWPLDEPRG